LAIITGGIARSQSLAHHAPMHPQLVRHFSDRPNTELIFPANLLE
jgi:hypothetical protein